MKKVKILLIKFMADRYGSGLTDHELKTLKAAHQCDLVVGVPVSQPLKGVEYPYFEIKEYEVKEESFVDTYEDEIQYLKTIVKNQDIEITNLRWRNAAKVDKKYK